MTNDTKHAASERQEWTETLTARASDDLSRGDPVLAALAAARGAAWTPRFRPPGFTSLADLILEQQFSLAWAKQRQKRLRELVDPLTPAGVLALGADAMRAETKLPRSRATCVIEVAKAIDEDRLDLPGLADLDDEAAMDVLLGVRGIGPWTAGAYLMWVLGRPNAWIRGDAGVRRAAKGLYGADANVDALAESWRPWRAVASRLLLWWWSPGARSPREVPGLAREEAPQAKRT